jgi:hypothetical protein
MHRIDVRALAAVAAVLAMATLTHAQQPPPPPPPGAAPVGLPDLSGTWKGTWGDAPTTLVIFKRSEAALVGQALSGLSNFASTVVGQGDSTVKGTLSTNGRAGPLSVAVNGRLGLFNNRLTLVLNAQPGWTWSDYQELVLTTVTPERMSGTGTSTAQWGPTGPVELKRETR